MMRRTTGLIAVLGAATLLSAGCGASKSSSSTHAASTSPTTPRSAAATPASGTGVAVTVKHAGKLGAILAAGPKKLTVYMFEGDKGTISSCSGACASAWPPVTTSGSPVSSGGASSTDLGTISRSDGTTQVTYKGHPLYYFAKDKDSGDSYGEGVNGFGASWYAVAPSGSKVDNS